MRYRSSRGSSPGAAAAARQKAGAIRRAVATVFEPASERGQRAMDELHQQTVNLLSFQPLPKDVFDVQVAFNMVARYGRALSPRSIPSRLASFAIISKISSADAPPPSFFYCRPRSSTATRSRFTSRWTIQSICRRSRNALAGDHIAIPGAEDEAPSNVSSAGQADIQVSEVRSLTAERCRGYGSPPTTSHRCSHRGRMRRKYDRHPPTGKIQ